VVLVVGDGVADELRLVAGRQGSGGGMLFRFQSFVLLLGILVPKLPTP
jgi:hypothetical protein